MTERKTPEPIEGFLNSLSTLGTTMDSHLKECIDCINRKECREWTDMVANYNLQWMALVNFEREVYGKETIYQT